jgi:hypothetical protein
MELMEREMVRQTRFFATHETLENPIALERLIFYTNLITKSARRIVIGCSSGGMGGVM